MWEELWYTEVDTYDKDSSPKGHGILAEAMQNANPKTREITLDEEGRAYLEYALGYMADMKSMGEIPKVRLVDIKKAYDAVRAKASEIVSQGTEVKIPGTNIQVSPGSAWNMPTANLQRLFVDDRDMFLAMAENAPPGLSKNQYAKLGELVPDFRASVS